MDTCHQHKIVGEKGPRRLEKGQTPLVCLFCTDVQVFPAPTDRHRGNFFSDLPPRDNRCCSSSSMIHPTWFAASALKNYWARPYGDDSTPSRHHSSVCKILCFPHTFFSVVFAISGEKNKIEIFVQGFTWFSKHPLG